MMRRRAFMAGLGAVAAWPLAARAQQGERVRRIGILDIESESVPGTRAQWAAFREALAKLGWTEGRNLQTEFRFAEFNLERIGSYAAELMGLSPDALVTLGAPATQALRKLTQTVPIIFVGGSDPTASGLVKNIARPEGNATGFPTAEPSIAGKWLGLLKEAAARVVRTAVIFHPDVLLIGPSYIASIEAAAPALSVEIVRAPVRNAVEIVRAIDAFAATPNGGLLVLPPPPSAANLEAILQLEAQYQLPAIYGGGRRTIAAAGALIAYGADTLDNYRRAAGYVDRVLRGAKIAELPVQFPTKYDLVINLKTAKAIGLTIPESLLLRADELIE
jgi:putative tryptophan/tyrosine transport system substrate-binding protein